MPAVWFPWKLALDCRAGLTDTRQLIQHLYKVPQDCKRLNLQRRLGAASD